MASFNFSGEIVINPVIEFGEQLFSIPNIQSVEIEKASTNQYNIVIWMNGCHFIKKEDSLTKAIISKRKIKQLIYNYYANKHN